MTHSNVAQNKTQRMKPPLPVDRGWAWFIMIGASTIIMLAVMFPRSLSVLLPEVLERFKAPAAVTTLAFGMCDLSWSITNIIIPTLLLPRFSVRTLALFGSLCHCLGVIALAYSPNIIVFNCIFSVFGVAGGLMILPSVIHVGHFFKKRLSLASSVTQAGGSAATVFVPLLTRFLVDNYNYQGALLVIAGLSFNCFAASLLLRPLSMYSEPESVKELQVLDSNDQKSEYSDFSYNEKLPLTLINDQDEEQVNEKSKFLTNEDFKSSHLNTTNNSHDLNKSAWTEAINGDLSYHTNEDTEETVLISMSKLNPTNSTSRNSVGKELKEPNPFISKVEPFPKENQQIDVLNLKNLISSSEDHIISNSINSLTQPSQNGANQHKFSSTLDSVHFNNTLESKEPQIRDSDNDKFPQISLKSEESSSPTKQLVQADDDDSNHLQESVDPASSGCLGRIRKFRAYISSSVLFNPVAVMLILAGGLSTPGGNMYVPVLGLENGLSSKEVPWILTMMGVADIVGKLGIGYFADLGYLRPIRIVCMTQLTVGLMCQFTMFYTGFGPMAAMATIFGLTSGIIQSLITPIIIELVGLQYLAPITSGFFLTTGVVTFIFNVSVGALRDATGHFYGGFNFLGGLFLTSFVILLMEPLFVKFRDRLDAKSRKST